MLCSAPAPAVLMVRPAAFGFNPQTAASNRFQRDAASAAGDPAVAARAEFDRLAAALRSEGIATCVVEDVHPPVRPDAVFPNNWISFHADGTVVLYPLQAPNRRLERRDDVLQQVAAQLGFPLRRLVDLTHHERHGRYLEGTGSLVLDHRARRAFACRSSRTDADVAVQWARELDYELVLFDARAPDGAAPYHTNVVLWIGMRCAGVYAEGIAPADRARVLAALGAGTRDVVALDAGAITNFAGNMLELGTWDEALGAASVLVMSTRARAALDAPTRARLRASVDELLAVPVPTIEGLGGGSVRCMLAEVPEVRT
ncbi:MAG: amidinotransferase [Gammaproteobacteria bacterium]|nr:amidinotransferase [Gammaproteobacteria bacterium]